MTSIWRAIYRNNLEGLFGALIAAPDADAFYTAAEPVFVQVAIDDSELDDATSKLETQAEAYEAKGGPFSQLAESIRSSLKELQDFDDEDDTDEWQDDGLLDLDDLHPLFQQDMILLADSHMFFDDPWASLEYDEINRQLRDALNIYQQAVTNVVGAAGTAQNFFVDPDENEAMEALWWKQVESEVGTALTGWHTYWSVADWVYFLTHDQEDKELPIQIGFGRVNRSALEQGLRDLSDIKGT